MAGVAPAARRGYAGRSAEQRRSDRRERLLTAGLELFGTEGYQATTIERLCAAANVSTRNFYEEFGSREQLLLTLHDQITVRAAQALLESLAGTENSSLEVRIGKAVRAYLKVTSTDPRWARICYVEVIGAGESVQKQRIEWRERIGAFLVAEAERAVTRGEGRKREFWLSAMALIGAVNELVHYWSTTGRQVPLDDICDELTRLGVAILTG
jgi:AcrR family transcriptional regulator